MYKVLRTARRLTGNVAIVAVLLLGSQAQADLILGPGDAFIYGTGPGGICATTTDRDCDGPGTSKILDWLDANVTGFDSSLEKYKSDVTDTGSSDSGAFAGSYDTLFTNSMQDALISRTASGPTLLEAMWLFVKDGNNAPVWYLFDISGWDGLMSIDLNGFWVGPGAISHVAIYGGREGECCTQVSEPGTLALVGLGLMAAGLRRRRPKV